MDQTMSLLELFELGGPFMWPLLVFSIATVGLILERVVYLALHDLRVRDIRDAVVQIIRRDGLEAAREYCAGLKQRRGAKTVFVELLAHTGMGEHRMEKAAEAEGNERVRSLENGFNLLQAIAGIAPLCGFLGTVSGMIGAFRSIAEADQVNAQLVAHGIYEALITTVYGLIIAIIALSAVNILMHVVDSFAAHVEKAVSDTITAVLAAGESA
ncbi:MotA/TolQ/ExbB proton channel family protein [Spirochaeta africana]|uniref:Biopolymer transport protein n=1 Tax=Spirochaeta africana (strain ATCC 700263 / DSM 8902 / Z-7692) TaxID=889378 RepID=H9ULH9_SPIAZ|nr:MotA/TolQ/ExbB proton channel family protein [Spirochaeta africana]AFG38372.1 biopolymer transport protein [Spirochaeta africana DSM 8902]